MQDGFYTLYNSKFSSYGQKETCDEDWNWFLCFGKYCTRVSFLWNMSSWLAKLKIATRGGTRESLLYILIAQDQMLSNFCRSEWVSKRKTCGKQTVDNDYDVACHQQSYTKHLWTDISAKKTLLPSGTQNLPANFFYISKPQLTAILSGACNMTKVRKPVDVSRSN